MRKLLVTCLLGFLFLNSAQIALAQDPGAEDSATHAIADDVPAAVEVVAAPAMFVEPAPKSIMDWVALTVGGATALAALLRALAIFIMWFAKKTKTETDDKAAALLERTADLVGKIPEIMGGMLTPKKAVIAKATKLGMVHSDDNGTKAA